MILVTHNGKPPGREYFKSVVSQAGHSASDEEVLEEVKRQLPDAARKLRDAVASASPNARVYVLTRTMNMYMCIPLRQEVPCPETVEQYIPMMLSLGVIFGAVSNETARKLDDALRVEAYQVDKATMDQLVDAVNRARGLMNDPRMGQMYNQVRALVGSLPIDSSVMLVTPLAQIHVCSSYWDVSCRDPMNEALPEALARYWDIIPIELLRLLKTAIMIKHQS